MSFFFATAPTTTTTTTMDTTESRAVEASDAQQTSDRKRAHEYQSIGKPPWNTAEAAAKWDEFVRRNDLSPKRLPPPFNSPPTPSHHSPSRLTHVPPPPPPSPSPSSGPKRAQKKSSTPQQRWSAAIGSAPAPPPPPPLVDQGVSVEKPELPGPFHHPKGVSDISIDTMVQRLAIASERCVALYSCGLRINTPWTSLPLTHSDEPVPACVALTNLVRFNFDLRIPESTNGVDGPIFIFIESHTADIPVRCVVLAPTAVDVASVQINGTFDNRTNTLSVIVGIKRHTDTQAHEPGIFGESSVSKFRPYACFQMTNINTFSMQLRAGNAIPFQEAVESARQNTLALAETQLYSEQSMLHHLEAGARANNSRVSLIFCDVPDFTIIPASHQGTDLSCTVAASSHLTGTITGLARRAHTAFPSSFSSSS